MEHAGQLELVRQTLAAYDEPLLRQVAGRLARPRGHWPPEELIERCLTTLTNPVVLDRRLGALEPAHRKVLALIGHSRQPVWAMGRLFEMLLALGHQTPFEVIFTLLENGLLFPFLGPPPTGAPAAAPRIRTFEQWLGFAQSGGLLLFAPLAAAERCRGEDLGLPDLHAVQSPASPREADGLEWLLRLAGLWQQVVASPLRRTQQGGFFKKDHERLLQDPLLSGDPADTLVPVPHQGFFLAALAEAEGMLVVDENEVHASSLPDAWEKGLSAALCSLFTHLPHLRGWNPLEGWEGQDSWEGSPYPSASLLALLLLARLPSGSWASPEDLHAWLMTHHPYWASDGTRPSKQQPWINVFLLGVCYHLRLIQAGQAGDGEWLVRLSDLGRALLGFQPTPADPPVYPQTLLVQPNLDIIAYRQGLTPLLIARLTRLATWKQLGLACTLHLEPHTVYRALEAGESFDSIQHLLEQHSARALPDAVLSSLRTWSDKRERIAVYPSAVLLEFARPEDLQEALARGVDIVRLTDTLALATSEEAIDFKHFRLTFTRDYTLPPDQCVAVEDDGLTLVVDVARADLLLETELPRFAEPVEGAGRAGQRVFRLTAASLRAARDQGWTAASLDAWFAQRAGHPLPAAARVLLEADQIPPLHLGRYLVLDVGLPEVADGLMQWPETRALIRARLGPAALVVEEDAEQTLRERLASCGLRVEEGEAPPGK